MTTVAGDFGHMLCCRVDLSQKMTGIRAIRLLIHKGLMERGHQINHLEEVLIIHVGLHLLEELRLKDMANPLGFLGNLSAVSLMLIPSLANQTRNTRFQALVDDIRVHGSRT